MIYQLFNSLERCHYHFTIYHNFNYIPHFHEYFEVVYVVEGETSITVNNKTSVVAVDEMALILPNQIHSFKTENTSVTWVALFSADLVWQYANDQKYKMGDDFKFSCPVSLRDYFARSMQSVNIDDIYELKAFLYTICSIYVKSVKLIPRSEKSDFTSTHKIMEYVSVHFLEDITLKHLAGMFGYNQNYLSRSFNKGIGMNFRQFLNELRIEYAKSKLLETDSSIADIAFESNFGSIRNFNRAFLGSTGITPSEFKKANAL